MFACQISRHRGGELREVLEERGLPSPGGGRRLLQGQTNGASEERGGGGGGRQSDQQNVLKKIC